MSFTAAMKTIARPLARAYGDNIGLPRQVGGYPIRVGWQTRWECLDGESTLLRQFLRFLPQDAVVYDVGAHLGIYSLAIAAACPRVHVVAIEPTPDTFAALSTNVRLSRAQDRVDCLQVAVGRENGMASFAVVPDSSTLNRLHTAYCDVSAQTEYIQVQVRSLDDIALTRPAPTVVKIDVEGFEHEVIWGMRRLLAQPEPIVSFVEVHPWFRPYDPQDLRAFVGQFGYRFYDLELRQKDSFGEEYEELILAREPPAGWLPTGCRASA